MLDGMLGQSSIPALERSLQFMAARHKLLASNIANADTPGYRPVDVDPRRFEAALGQAIEESQVDRQGGLVFDESAPVAFTGQGVELRPEVTADNVLFHDDNDRSLERLMQRLTENVASFRAASQLMRKQFDLINSAIRERP